MKSEGLLPYSQESATDPFLKQVNSTHSYRFPKYVLILSSRPCLGLLSVQTSILHNSHVSHAYNMPHTSHPLWFDRPNYIWRIS